MIRNDRARFLRWAAGTRNRHRAVGAALRTAAPCLPRAVPPQEPVFILGSPRSGTTMLFAMLDCSPALASLGMGSQLLWEMYHPIERTGHESHAVAADEIAVHERRVLDWMIHRITGGTRYLDKYPRMCLRVGYLCALYPDARFIYIVRDGRAAVSSMITGWRTPARFGHGIDLPVELQIDGYSGRRWKFLVPPGWRDFARGRSLAEVCAFQWTAANQAVLDARPRVAARRWIDVRYEDLVANPVTIATAILDRLDLRQDGVVEWASHLSEHVSRTALTPPRPDKWRDENPAEIESVMHMIMPTMSRLGYRTDATTPS